MIICKITGYEVRKGEFAPDENKPNEKVSFENILFHFMTNDNPDVVGTATSIYGMSAIKIPAKDLKKIANVSAPDELVSKRVSPFWVPRGKEGIRLESLEILRDIDKK